MVPFFEIVKKHSYALKKGLVPTMGTSPFPHLEKNQ